MSRALAAAAVVLAGCASSYQSARVLPRGHTEVTTAMTRTSVFDDGNDGSFWMGNLQVRHGVTDQVELGARLDRNPGWGENVSALAFDPKVQVTRPDSPTAVSLALPIGLAWVENTTADPSEFEDGILVLMPSLYFGHEVSPGVELVIAPKVPIYLPEGKTEDADADLALGLGVRVHDATRSWAIHPELTLGTVNALDEEDRATMVSFGVGISAAN